jgi:hypothetical protein
VEHGSREREADLDDVLEADRAGEPDPEDRPHSLGLHSQAVVANVHREDRADDDDQCGQLER